MTRTRKKRQKREQGSPTNATGRSRSRSFPPSSRQQCSDRQFRDRSPPCAKNAPPVRAKTPPSGNANTDSPDKPRCTTTATSAFAAAVETPPRPTRSGRKKRRVAVAANPPSSSEVAHKEASPVAEAKQSPPRSRFKTASTHCKEGNETISNKEQHAESDGTLFESTSKYESGTDGDLASVPPVKLTRKQKNNKRANRSSRSKNQPENRKYGDTFTLTIPQNAPELADSDLLKNALMGIRGQNIKNICAMVPGSNVYFSTAEGSSTLDVRIASPSLLQFVETRYLVIQLVQDVWSVLFHQPPPHSLGAVAVNSATQFGYHSVPMSDTQYGDHGMSLPDAQYGHHGIAAPDTHDGHHGIPILNTQYSHHGMPISDTQYGHHSMPIPDIQYSDHGMPMSDTQYGHHGMSISDIQYSDQGMPIPNTQYSHHGMPISDTIYGHHSMPIPDTHDGHHGIPIPNTQYSLRGMPISGTQYSDHGMPIPDIQYSDHGMPISDTQYGHHGMPTPETQYSDHGMPISDTGNGMHQGIMPIPDTYDGTYRGIFQ